LQKKVIRSVCNAKYTAHTEPLFKDLNILPLDKLIIFTKGMLTHSIVHKYSPPALFNQWEFNYERNHFELQNNNDMYIPRAAAEYVKKKCHTSRLLLTGIIYRWKSHTQTT
jgi:hypothetical protein